jgi:hypothetical protein
VSGTTFSWIVFSSSNVNGASAGSGTQISQVLTSTDGITSGTVTYRITPTANGCSGTPVDVVVTVNPVPVITNTAPQLQTTICSGTALNFTPTSSVAGTTYSWTSLTIGTVSGISASGAGAITDTPINTGNTTGIVIYTITPSVGGCNGASRDFIVTVNPIPDAFASDEGICSGQSTNVAITNPNGVSGTTYSWIVFSSSNVSGASAGSGSVIGQVLTSTDGISSGTVTYQITPSAGGCNGTPINVTVTVSPAPVITNTAAQLQATICSGTSLNFTPTSSIVGTTFAWTSSVLGPLSGVTASGSGAITDTPVNTGNITGTITYTITPTIAGCSGTPRDYVVTVSPIPDVAASDQGICSGQSTNVIITNPNGVFGTTFNWTVQSSLNVNGAANGSGNVIGQVLTSADGVSSGTVVYEITPVASGCIGSPITVTVTVSPSPVITNTSTQLQTTICSGTPLNFTPTSSIAGTTYTWTSVVVGPISGVTASGSGAITDTPLNTGNITGTVTYTILPTVGGCSGVPRDYVVTVNPIPDVAASDQGICSGDATNVIISNPNGVTGTTFNWIIQSSSNVSGASGGSGDVISQVLTSADGINNGTVVYRITPTANGCIGSFADVTVTVSPKPVITDPSTSFIADICSGDALNLLPTSSVVGTTFSWTSSVIGSLSGVSASGNGAITDVPVNATNTAAVIIYTVTPSFGGCNGTPVNYVVTVKPIPDVAAADETICSGLSTNISITNPNGVSGTTFDWIIQNSTNVTGASAGTGNIISQVLTSTDGITNGTVIYRITPTANGCAGSFIDVTVTVKPVPVVTNNPVDLSQQICSGDALNFLPTTSIAGATFTWTTVITGPIDPGSVTASGSSSIVDSPINTSNVPGTVTYNITPSFNGCDGPPVDFVVLVRPLPSATAANLTICSGENAVISISPAPVNVAGTTFSWTVTPSANVTGAANGNGSTINQLLSTTDANVGTVIYTITPAANGCSGVPLNVTVTVNPRATVSAGSDFAVCEPVTIPLIGTLGGSASTGTWTIIAGSGTISPSTTTGTSVTATYTVHPDDIGNVVVFRITTNDPDVAGPCVPVFDEVNVNVNRQARLTLPADYAICEPFSIDLNGLLSGSATSGNWSVISGAGILSASSVTGSNVTATYVLDNPTDVSTTLTFRLTTNDPDGTGPCVAEFDEINITINESAKVDAATSRFNNEFCENEPIQLTGSLSGATSSVTWSGGSGAAQFADVTNPNTIYTLTAADIAAGSITLTLTTNDPDGGGPCLPASDQVVVIINPLPAVFLSGLAPSYAENDPPVLMDGFPNNPPGVFSGPGVLAGTNIFDPGNANIGPNTITYTYTDNKNCQNSASRIVVVNELTDIDFEIFNGVSYVGGLTPEICGDIGRAYLRGSPPVSSGLTPTVDTYFSSPDIPARIGYDGSEYYLDTDGLAAGTYYIQYTYTNNVSATSSLIKEVTVYASPIASIVANNACENDLVQFTDASFIPPNVLGGVVDTWLWDFDDQDLQSPLQNPTYTYVNANIYDVSLTVTTNQGCTNSTVQSITVGPPPTVDFTWSGICNTQSTQFTDLSTIDVSFSTIERYQWDFGDGDVTLTDLGGNAIPPGTHSGRTTGTYKDPSHAYALSNEYDVRLTVETDVGCVKDVVKRVYILSYPTATPTSGYFENFESGSGTWFRTSLSGTSWVFGTPTGSTINLSNSGTNAWWTGANSDFSAHNGTYNANEKSEVIGPCLDISGLERPMISLNYWSDLQMGFDGAVIQYSVDGGASWQTIGDADGGGIDWYNSTNLSGNPGGQDNYAWSDSTSGWRNARFNLDQIPFSDRDQVIFRIAFGSNDDNPFGQELNGFAFDDVYIGEKRRNVLVEYFTNRTVSGSPDDHFNDLYDDETDPGVPGYKLRPDFFKLQYHVESPDLDSVNVYNRTAPAARSLLYGVSQPPASVMDGLLGKYKASPSDSIYFNGNSLLIDKEEIDRRALIDPRFDISLSIDPVAPGEENKVKGQINLEYVDSTQTFSDPVVLHMALVDDTVTVNYSPNLRRHKYVVRKLLLGDEGMLIQASWANGTIQQIPFDKLIDVPISNGYDQYLVVWVQDRYAKGEGNSRVIHQSLVSPAIQRQGVKPVGLEDDPIAAEIRDIQIYPNPANNVLKFNLQNQLTRNYNWRMIDQRGVTVLSGDVNQFFDTPQEIDISRLANGIYFIQIGIGNTSIIHRKIAVMNRN